MNDINQEKISLLLQYILVVAGQESGWDRELGAIHLIKYAYLADLAYSEYHDGKTYTGIPWKFYHFGPWSVELFKSIDPALDEIGATKKRVESPKYDKDLARWSIESPKLFDDIGNKIDLAIMSAVQRYVRDFGNDTAKLLDYVYKTKPMISAAPGELLDFSIPVLKDKEIKEKGVEGKRIVTTTQLKKRKAKLFELKKRINDRIEIELKAKKECAFPPRYDSVFFQGIDWLDSLAGEPIEEGEHTVAISDKMWKSKARFNPDVS